MNHGVKSIAILLLSLTVAQGARAAIPAVKNLDAAWVESLTDKGIQKVYTGAELNHIGMPVGGIGAGQLYIRGDGALAKWWLFNNGTPTADHTTDYTNEITKPITSSIDQGFSITVNGTTTRLDQTGFDAIQFVGEYPIATIKYLTTGNPKPPVDVTLEAYSPFIPLNAKESALPATIMHFSVVNSSSSAVSATLTGWLKDSRVTLSLLQANGTVKGSSTNDVDAVVSLAPGEKKDVVFLVTWYYTAGDQFIYNTWFPDVAGVTHYVAQNYTRLSTQTHLFHTAYYDQTTLPYWFVQRIAMPVGTLASETSRWLTSGRFYATEGVGLGPGTCTHVYNYAQAMGRLFPELERSVRTLQDLAPGVGFQSSGMVGFRGETDYNYFGGYAADGQCGTVLKAYREHLMSADTSFLQTNWTKIKKVMDYMVAQDPDANGILIGMQPQTFDCAYYGPNTFVGSLYLAALRAAEEMARTMGDDAAATKYHTLFASGKAWTEQNLYNADGYFFHQPGTGDGGCSYGNRSLADQMFGQNWAHQLGLGYLYSPDKVQSALKNVYKYNWAPNVADGPLDAYGRKYAIPGEAGLFNTIYVSGEDGNQLFENEIWTGVEYEAGTGMIQEGLLTEGLAVIRGVHDRYSATKRNPWDEVEYGEHYGRAMASWGALIAVSGYEYDGPAGKIGFSPKLRPEDFRSFFSAAEGWGTIAQTRTASAQTNEIAVSYGSLRVTKIVLDVPVGLQSKTLALSRGGTPVQATNAIVNGQFVLTLATPVVVRAGEVLRVAIGTGGTEGSGGSANSNGGSANSNGGSNTASGGTNSSAGATGAGAAAGSDSNPAGGASNGACSCRSASRSGSSPSAFALLLAWLLSNRAKAKHRCRDARRRREAYRIAVP